MAKPKLNIKDQKLYGFFSRFIYPYTICYDDVYTILKKLYNIRLINSTLISFIQDEIFKKLFNLNYLCKYCGPFIVEPNIRIHSNWITGI